MTIIRKRSSRVQQGGNNNHHKMQYAEAFPEIAYTKMVKTGKLFVYDNRIIQHGQMPIARIDNSQSSTHKLIYRDKVVFKGTLKECLAYTRDHLLNLQVL